ncbi:iron-binding apoprotein IscA [Phreatobacter oligotrophus]|uniref:Iron-binding apoprotein IscA n=2 Tax=Phreatobacter oligotrophus TaxID=1122261 RepID=A0A2T4Z607_9HYPH|nr:Fe-S cluster assembly scaffold SufA [Phreatobacter oligotrophus]PTM57312.1 iron-binding apoprotein IscA [Phreatobacter oligotrophus]
MPKMQAMRLTEAAADRVRDLVLASGKDSAGLRVGVTKGGCAGMEYTMEFVDEPGKFDEIVEDRGVRVFIDAKAVLYLLGTEMDYVTDKLSARFVFNNPNQTSACGCGESIALTPARPEALGTA